MPYKRNQVEEAIFRTLGARDARVEELRFRLKRLLATDRGEGRDAKAVEEWLRHYAFFSQEPPGSGIEILFSSYEAFALLGAILLLEHGLPQARAVKIMRQARRQLEVAHRRVLKTNPHGSDQIDLSPRPAGSLATFTKDPLFLAFVRVPDALSDNRRGDIPVIVCRSEKETFEFMWKHADVGPGISTFEFGRLMRVMAGHLSKTRIVKRGRGAA